MSDELTSVTLTRPYTGEEIAKGVIAPPYFKTLRMQVDSALVTKMQDLKDRLVLHQEQSKTDLEALADIYQQMMETGVPNGH